jgi:hypothetical protein
MTFAARRNAAGVTYSAPTLSRTCGVSDSSAFSARADCLRPGHQHFLIVAMDQAMGRVTMMVHYGLLADPS